MRVSCVQAKADFFEKQRQQAEAEAQARFWQNSLQFFLYVFCVVGGIGCLLDLSQVQQAHYGLSCRLPAVRRIAFPHCAAHSLLILLILQNAASAVHCSQRPCLLILLYYAILCYANNNYRTVPNCAALHRCAGGPHSGGAGQGMARKLLRVQPMQQGIICLLPVACLLTCLSLLAHSPAECALRLCTFSRRMCAAPMHKTYILYVVLFVLVLPSQPFDAASGGGK